MKEETPIVDNVAGSVPAQGIAETMPKKAETHWPQRSVCRRISDIEAKLRYLILFDLRGEARGINVCFHDLLR
jgi:hypothetical protein